jgi:hypothetical protein
MPQHYVLLLTSAQYNDWKMTSRDAFAESYMSTSTPALSPPVRCCARCSALLDNSEQVTYPGTETCGTITQGCEVCTLLLRQARYDGRSEDNADINIVRLGAALQEEATGVRLLRLCCDTGPSLTPYLQARNNTDAYIQRSKPRAIIEPHSTWPANCTKT